MKSLQPVEIPPVVSPETAVKVAIVADRINNEINFQIDNAEILASRKNRVKLRGNACLD